MDAISPRRSERSGRSSLVGLLLGAGLPALFALGIRSLNSSRTVAVSASRRADMPERARPSKASAAGVAGAIVCFGISIAAVLFGIVVIIFGKQLFGV